MPSSYPGIYRARVTNSTDPSLLKRIRFQCPQIAGTAELNWASPINMQDPVPSPGTLLWIAFNGGDLTKPIYITNTSFTTAPQSGTATGTVQLVSQPTVSNPDSAGVYVVSGPDGVATGSTSAPHVSFKDTNGTSAVDLFLSGTVIKRDLAGNRHIWHTPAMGTGWATGPNSGTVQAIQYRLDPLDNLVIVGTMHSTSATPAATLFQLPGVGGYRPSIAQRKGIITNASGTITPRMVEIGSTGNVTLTPALAASANDVYFDVTVPIGNIS